MSLRLAIVVGARPQFIKYAPIHQELAKTSIHQLLIHTGQHYDESMSGLMFEQLGLPSPDFNLGICNTSHSNMVGLMMMKLEEIFLSNNVDAVLVFGDTNSTLAAALVYSKIDSLKLIHVEAGERSYNRKMPEEVNRVITDHVSDLLFCSTQASIENLKKEGIFNKVYLTGDVMYDSILLYSSKAPSKDNILNKLEFKYKKYNLATIHRAENVDNLAKIFDYLEEESQYPILLPLHPATQKNINKNKVNTHNIQTISPVGYLEMITLMKHANLIYTDSGGIQKESYFLRTPCVILRNETEWVETINCGWNRLWTNKDYLSRRDSNEYGNGNAANKIVNLILQNI